jgi:hypothetical protein
MDFLSALGLEGELAWPNIVMNSTTMNQKTIEAIRAMGARVVWLYLARDDSGRQLTGLYRQELPHVAVQYARSGTR